MILSLSISESNGVRDQYSYFHLGIKLYYPWLVFNLHLYQHEEQFHIAGHLGKWWFAQPRIKGV